MLGATIGAIEIGHDRVRVAVVKLGGKLPQVLELVERAAEFESAAERVVALGAVLGDALDTLKTRPQAYVLSANALYTVVRTLAIPFRGARRVASAVPFELEPYLAFPLEDLAVDFTTIGEFDGETEVLAMGMRRQQLEEQMEILREAGIETDAVTLDALALTGLWIQVAKPGKGLDAVLHVRAEGSVLAVVSNKRMAYFRVLGCNGETLAENPGVASREVNNTLRAFLSKWRGEGDITQLNVTGMDFTHEQREAFVSALGMPINDTMMISHLQGGSLALENGAAGGKLNHWDGLVGAALGATGSGFSVNFGQGDAVGSGPVRSVISHMLFTSCLGLILMAGWGFYYYQGRIQNEAQTRELTAQVEKITAEIEALGQQVPEGIDADIFSAPNALEILQELARNMPEEKVQIREIRVQPPGMRGGWLIVSGTANDASVFNEVYAKLRESTLFIVDEQPNISVEGTETKFSFRANRVEAETTDEPGNTANEQPAA